MRLLRPRKKQSDPPKTQGGNKGPDGVSQFNKYNFTLSDEQISAGEHRKRVGPHWDEIGKHQFEFLVEQGLSPDSRFLDVGCGSLRGGIHFVRYLDPENYFGIDINSSLLYAGLHHEIPAAGLTDKLPAANLKTTTIFECDFGVTFDFLLAQSVFSHLPLNHIRLCLYQTARVTQPGARFFATFFERPPQTSFDQSVKQKNTTTHPERDPYHYLPSDLEWAATSVAPWRCHYIGDWGHIRGQQMMEFIRE